jgi:hypothetical protein
LTALTLWVDIVIGDTYNGEVVMSKKVWVVRCKEDDDLTVVYNSTSELVDNPWPKCECGVPMAAKLVERI